MKVPLAGGAPVTLYSGPIYPAGIAVDATSLYWVGSSTASVGTLAMKLTPK